MNESDSMYFNGYTYDTVPDVPYGTGGIPQYNPMTEYGSGPLLAADSYEIEEF